MKLSTGAYCSTLEPWYPTGGGISRPQTRHTQPALACPSNKLNTSLFRLFRWSPDFKLGKNSTFVAVWVKFFNLPLHYYNESTLIRLGSTLGNILGVHKDTLNLTQRVFAKVCIEMDVTKPFFDPSDPIWIGTSKEQGWKIDLEYQGNPAYCTFCGLLWHTVGLCRNKYLQISSQINPLQISSQSVTIRIHTPHQQDCVVSWVCASCLARIWTQLWDHLRTDCAQTLMKFSTSRRSLGKGRRYFRDDRFSGVHSSCRTIRCRICRRSIYLVQ